MRGEGEIDWDGEMREWIKRGGGERKKGWSGVQYFYYNDVYALLCSIVCIYTCVFLFLSDLNFFLFLYF